MVPWATQRPRCPALCPVGHVRESSKGDGDFRGLRCLEVSFQRGVSQEVEGGLMSALYKEGFSGLCARRCLHKCGEIVPAHHPYWDSVLWAPVSVRLWKERHEGKQQSSLVCPCQQACGLIHSRTLIRQHNDFFLSLFPKVSKMKVPKCGLNRSIF